MYREFTSRMPGFYRLPVKDQLDMIASVCDLSEQSVEVFTKEQGLDLSVSDHMIENVVGNFALPVGLGLNFLIDEREYIVPMVVEEPSVVAAVSNKVAGRTTTGMRYSSVS